MRSREFVRSSTRHDNARSSVGARAVVARIVAGEEQAQVNAVAVLHPNAQKSRAPVACDAYAHILSDDTNLVVLHVVVDRSDGVGGSIATSGRSDKAIDERPSSNITTVVADSTDDVYIRTGCLSEYQHGRLIAGTTIAPVELTPGLALLRRNSLDATHASVVDFALIAQR